MHQWERGHQTITMVDDTNVTVTLITPNPQDAQQSQVSRRNIQEKPGITSADETCCLDAMVYGMYQVIKGDDLDLFQYSHARKRVWGKPSEEQIRATLAAYTAKEIAALSKDQQQKMEVCHNRTWSAKLW